MKRKRHKSSPIISGSLSNMYENMAGNGWLTAMEHGRKQASCSDTDGRAKNDSPKHNDATHWCKPWMEGLSQSESNSFHTCSSEMHLHRWSCEVGIWHTSHCQQKLYRTQVDKLRNEKNEILNFTDSSSILTGDLLIVLESFIYRSYFWVFTI